MKSSARGKALQLPLLLLLAAGCACGTAVHEVAISVRSVRSVTYLGTQVSIFQHVSMPLRYFFQPLSFFDAASVRVRKEEGLNVLQKVHFDVYMWTEEFLELVRSHFPAAESVELMPLTQIRLTWSQEAALWLGDGFNDTWRLLDEWKDADKPQMRTTFTVACDAVASCQLLQRLLNESRESAGSLFDLQYWIQGQSSYNATLAVGGSQFQRSKVFKQLEQLQRNEVFVMSDTVDALAKEVMEIAVSDVHSHERHRLNGERIRILGSALPSLHAALRSHQVESLSISQFECCFPWPADKLDLRPERMATALNSIFKQEGGAIYFKSLWKKALVKLQANMPPRQFRTIDTEVKAMRGHVKDITPKKIVDLAASVGSAVSWRDLQFKAALPKPTFRLRLKELGSGHRLLTQNVTVEHAVTLHSDPVRPLPTGPAARGRWQPRFADSFCVLANEADPPGMSCQDLTYSVSVRTSILGLLNLVHINATFTGGSVGRNHLYMPEKSKLEFALRVCCTKP